MINKLEISRHYIIFTGFFEYDKDLIKQKNLAKLSSVFQPWFTRLPVEDADYFLKTHIKGYYYSSFNNVSFPESSTPFNSYYEEIEGEKNFKIIPLDLYWNLNQNIENLLHLTKHKFNKDLEYAIKKDGKDILFKVEYADIYLYPKGEGIFTLKVEIKKSENKKISPSDVNDLLFVLRDPESKIYEYNNPVKSVREWLDIILFSSIKNSGNKIIDHGIHFSNKLKSFSVIETEFDINSEQGRKLENHLLYEMGTISPISSSYPTNQLEKKYNSLTPSSDYFNEIIENNKVSVFKDWTGLCLLDTFTIIINTPQSQNKRSIFENAEGSYLPLFIHTIYLKLFLFKINALIIKDKILDKKKTSTRDLFIKTKNSYDLLHISYNFLPNLILKKLRNAQEIENEIDLMENKLENLYNYSSEKQDKRSNLLLIILAVLTMGSTFWDISEWFQKLFNVDMKNYLATSGLIVLIILTIVFFALFINKKK